MSNINEFMSFFSIDTPNNESAFTEGIVLTQDEVVLSVGDSFDAESYIASAYDENGNNLIESMIIHEFIDTSEESEYLVSYIIQDEAGYTKYKKELHVFVKDTD